MLVYLTLIGGCSDSPTTPPIYLDGGGEFDATVIPCTNGCMQGASCLIDDKSACGPACIPCGPAQNCSAGVCVDPQPNCAAECSCCTALGDCVKTPSKQSCGFDQLLCQTCSGDDICDTAQKKCAPPPPAKKALFFVSLSPKASCGFGDTNCDVFAEIRSGTQLIRSTHVQDDVPQGSVASYNDLVLVDTPTALAATTLKLKIIDVDSANANDIIADCDVKIDSSAISAGTISQNCDGGENKVGTVIFSISDANPGDYIVGISSWTSKRSCTGTGGAPGDCNDFAALTIGGQTRRSGLAWKLKSGSKAELTQRMMIATQSDLLNGLTVEVWGYVNAVPGGESKLESCQIAIDKTDLQAGQKTVAKCGSVAENLLLVFEKI